MSQSETGELQIAERPAPSVVARRQEFAGSIAIGLIMICGLITPAWIGFVVWGAYRIARLLIG